MKRRRHQIMLCVCILISLLMNVASTSYAAETISNDDLSIVRQKAKKLTKDTVKCNYSKKILVDKSTSLQITNDLSDYQVTFKSSNPDVLTVRKSSNDTCTYIGNSVGTAQIVIKFKQDKSIWFNTSDITIKLKISITPKAASVKFRKNKYQMFVGDKKHIDVTLRPSITAEQPTFTSNNKRICDFRDDGMLVAKSKGTTYIVASILNGKKAKCKIVVKKQASK